MTTEITSGPRGRRHGRRPGLHAARTGGGTGEQRQGGFPGGGEMPDFSQMGGGGGAPDGGPGQ